MLAKVKAILQDHQIQECSMEQGFEINGNGKIDGLSFVHSFFNMLMKKKNTLEYWAGEFFKLTGFPITSQGLSGKLQFRHEKFVKQFLKNVLRQLVVDAPIKEDKSSIIASFNKVYLEDSTCVPLPDYMFDFFPGTVNQNGATSTARIQFRLELKGGNYSNIDLLSYRNNDQSYSGNILKVLKANDLVIRDLGYWSLKVFRQIKEKKAYLLSRLQFQTQVFNPKNGKKIELYKKLRGLRKKGVNVLDMRVLVGKEEQLPMRVVAIKVPPQIEQQRKRKMRKDKLERRSDDYLEMLGWCIYVTNISEEELGAKEIQRLYGYRWRIEIIFKAWKSNINLNYYFNKKKKFSPPRAIITFYLILIWLSLFFVRWYNFFLIRIFEKKNKILSLFKFTDFLKENFEKIDEIAFEEETTIYLAKYCSQQKRKQKSSIELIYLLNYT